MLFEEIYVTGCYHIAYEDPSYPCMCPCHLPGSKLVHCVACCVDRSFVGVGVCVAKNNDDRCVGMMINPYRFLILREGSVIKLDYSPSGMPGAPALPTKHTQMFDITVDMIEYVRTVLGLHDE